MENLPKTIRIGGFDYDIVITDGLRSERDERLSGQIACEDLEVRVSADISDRFRPLVLWHEIIHGILQHAGISDHNEQQIEALAYGIMQVLRDNPWLHGADEEGTTVTGAALPIITAGSGNGRS
jgi:hypothetical protein